MRTEGASTPTHSAAFGVPGGTLSQTLNTIVGQTYSFDFDAGIFGKKTGSIQLRAQITGSSTLVDQTVTPPSANTTNSGAVTFLHFHYTFTANTATTKVQFSDTGPLNRPAT